VDGLVEAHAERARATDPTFRMFVGGYTYQVLLSHLLCACFCT
jgi:hypothetical protein